MAEFPTRIIERLSSSGVVATFAVERVEHAVPIAQALLRGGITAIELVLRTPVGLESAEAICDRVPEMLVGLGTVLTGEQVDAAKSVGADFGVAPGLNPNVVQAAQSIEFPFAPGIATPSELELAISLGCRFVKFFPAQAMGGVKFLNSMSAPYRHLGIQYFPLGGVNSDNMMVYLQNA